MQVSSQNLAINVSDSYSIRAYFEKVRELVKKGELFPVKLDDVWPLVYTRKGDAVRTLSADFTKGYDYQSVRKNAKRGTGGTVSHEYTLSVSCMEWLIARKVRAVFDVYREVFHKALDHAEKSYVERQEALVSLVNDLTEKVIGLEGKISRMHKARTKYFNAVVVDRKRRKQEQQAEKLESEFDAWREKFWRSFRSYIVECRNVHTPFQVERHIKEGLIRDYGIDVSRYAHHQQTGEHIFETLYRLGFGRQIYFILTCQLLFSSGVKQ